MSCYLSAAINPKTKKLETVMMVDDHFGRHNYGVLFQDGTVLPPDEVKMNEPGRGIKFFSPLLEKAAEERPKQTLYRVIGTCPECGMKYTSEGNRKIVAEKECEVGIWSPQEDEVGYRRVAVCYECSPPKLDMKIEEVK